LYELALSFCLQLEVIERFQTFLDSLGSMEFSEVGGAHALEMATWQMLSAACGCIYTYAQAHNIA
jgi:hypothetical protein